MTPEEKKLLLNAMATDSTFLPLLKKASTLFANKDLLYLLERDHDIMTNLIEIDIAPLADMEFLEKAIKITPLAIDSLSVVQLFSNHHLLFTFLKTYTSAFKVSYSAERRLVDRVLEQVTDANLHNEPWFLEKCLEYGLEANWNGYMNDNMNDDIW